MTNDARNPSPRVSVIIPAFNAARYLDAAVQSVLAQDFPAWELLIVDDGSTDETAHVATTHVEADPRRIRLLRHPGGANRGVAESRNLAAAQARGEYLAFLDADDQWRPAKLRRQVAWMDAHPDIGLSFTRSRILREGRGRNFIPGVDELGDEPPADRKEALVRIIMVTLNYIFSTVMVRTDCFRKTGGFPEALPFQSEDRIMVAKVCADHGVGLVPEMLCEYLAHDSSYSTGVVSANTAAAIFYDMQARIVRWLAQDGGKPGWGRDIAGAVLPQYFLPALFCRRECRIPRIVLADTWAVLRLFPDMAPYFALTVLRRSRPARAWHAWRQRRHGENMPCE